MTTSEAIAAHHRELTEKLAAEVARVENAQSDGAGLVAHLNDELLPHAAGEEKHLYPQVDVLMKQYGSATATMRVDHEEIGRLAREIASGSQSLQLARNDAERTERRAKLTRLGIQLEAILSLHARKEEIVYLPLFERHLSAEEQQRILDDMHEHADQVTKPSDEKVLDVRTLPPAQRHPLIFQTFDDLHTGEAFVLLNDHDPKPLYYHLSAERAGQVRWEYLEQGPDDWQVRIGKAE